MNSLKPTTKWCVNCGKDAIRCKCKEPVISAEESPIVSDRPDPLIVPTGGRWYGSGVRG